MRGDWSETLVLQETGHGDRQVRDPDRKSLIIDDSGDPINVCCNQQNKIKP